MSINIHSINANFDQLQIYLNYLGQFNCSFDAICVQKTWLSEKSNTSLLKLDGYTLLIKRCSSSAHGGLALYIKSDIAFSEIKTEESH